jgi:NDP-sugar pyrophosphorylase family protein
MQGIILASGKGKRLREGGQLCSKPMTMVAGKPLICYPIDAMLSCGITNIVIVCHNSAEDLLGIKNYNETYSRAITFADDSEQKGKLTAFNCAKGHVETPFILSYGDIVVQENDFKAMFQTALELLADNPDLIIQTIENPSIPPSDDEPWDRSILFHEGRIVKWVKGGAKADPNLYGSQAKVGGLIYLWAKNPFPQIEEFMSHGSTSHAAFLQDFVSKHNVYEMPIRDIWDIDVPERIKESEKLLCKNL